MDEINKNIEELEFTFKERLLVTLFLLGVLGLLSGLGCFMYKGVIESRAIELQENNLKNNCYTLVDLEWDKRFDDYGVRKVFAKKILAVNDELEKYPKDSIIIDGSNVFYLVKIGEAHIFPPSFLTEGRTYVSEDVQMSIAKKIIEGYSIVVK